MMSSPPKAFLYSFALKKFCHTEKGNMTVKNKPAHATQVFVTNDYSKRAVDT